MRILPSYAIVEVHGITGDAVPVDHRRFRATALTLCAWYNRQQVYPHCYEVRRDGALVTWRRHHAVTATARVAFFPPF